MRKKLRCYLPYVLLLFCALLYLIYSVAPAAMERIYTQKIYFYLAQGVSSLTALIPFSLAEALLYTLAGCVLWWLVRLCCGRLRHGVPLRRWVVDSLRPAWHVALYALVWFILFCGLNYKRPPVAQTLGYPLQAQYSATDLRALADYMVGQTNAACLQVMRTPDGRLNPVYTFDRMKEEVFRAYEFLERHSGLHVGGNFKSIKPFTFSKIMSYTYIMGFYFPWMVESTLNKDVPQFWIPALMAHEQAHARGYMREGDANYLAFRVGMATDNEELHYSALMHSLNYVLNALYRTDPEFHQVMVDALDKNVLQDFQENTIYWQAFSGPVAQASNKVNDTYLKANGQSQGVQSYGEVVDLLLAYHKELLQQMQQKSGGSVYISESE